MFSATDIVGTEAFLQRLLGQAEHLETIEMVASGLEVLVSGGTGRA